MRRLASLVVLLSIGVPAAPAQVWVFKGPAPITNGQVSPSGTAAGGVQRILVDPTNNNTLYIGATNGGVWKTTDGGTNWTPLTDNLGSNSIGALAMDPTNNQTVIAGFGRW